LGIVSTVLPRRFQNPRLLPASSGGYKIPGTTLKTPNTGTEKPMTEQNPDSETEMRRNYLDRIRYREMTRSSFKKKWINRGVWVAQLSVLISAQVMISGHGTCLRFSLSLCLSPYTHILSL